ncbi:MAG: metal-sulfur cluster assembly factor [Rhodocyclaceae bacterium]|jgi:metal-sulfur cluster biosynthetic enzyme|nr:MAG: metal-sulfur cluster assembly factor [Rhodocyclaceae bacterium]
MTAALDTELIRDALRKVVDPEVGANIVDLGLVYRIELSERSLLVEMTMTSPACPMGDLIVDDAHAELDRVLPADVSVNLQVVWEPPWNPSMMSEQCRLRLGWNDEESKE